MIKFVAILLMGHMSFASPGVLEHVATNRAAGITAIPIANNWKDYDVLLAVENCQYVGDDGLLYLDDGRVLTAIVVDCQSDIDREAASLSSLGLLADANRADIVHKFAVLVLQRSASGKHRIERSRK